MASRSLVGDFPFLRVTLKPHVFVSGRRGVLLGIRGLRSGASGSESRAESPPCYSECKNLRGLRAYKPRHLASFSCSSARARGWMLTLSSRWRKPGRDSRGGQWGASAEPLLQLPGTVKEPPLMRSERGSLALGQGSSEPFSGEKGERLPSSGAMEEL